MASELFIIQSNLAPYAWNIRGVGRKSFKRQVRELIRDYNSDITIKSFNYPNFIEIPQMR